MPATLPLTKLANTAIDAVAERRGEVADDIVKYAATDLVCYRAEYPAELVAAQAAAWDPILSWAAAKLGAPLLTTAGIAHVAQPEASLAALRGVVAAMDAFRLAALHVMTSLTGSALYRAGPRRRGVGQRRRLGRRPHGRDAGRFRIGARTLKRPSA